MKPKEIIASLAEHVRGIDDLRIELSALSVAGRIKLLPDETQDLDGYLSMCYATLTRFEILNEHFKGLNKPTLQ